MASSSAGAAAGRAAVFGGGVERLWYEFGYGAVVDGGVVGGSLGTAGGCCDGVDAWFVGAGIAEG